MLYANDIALQGIENRDNLILGCSIYGIFCHCLYDVIHNRQVFLLTDVHAFVRSEHIFACIWLRSTSACTKELKCHSFGMLNVFDIFEASFDDGISQVSSHDIIHDASDSISPAQALIKCRHN
jgi:hypothetical protein